jgi:uncharacterized protein YggT (Ycf19 family)
LHLEVSLQWPWLSFGPIHDMSVYEPNTIPDPYAAITVILVVFVFTVVFAMLLTRSVVDNPKEDMVPSNKLLGQTATPLSRVMRNKTTIKRWFDTFYLIFIFGLAVVAGILTATYFHRGGWGWFGSSVGGVLFGIPGILIGHMFLQGAFRFVWLGRYIWHKIQQR